MDTETIARLVRDGYESRRGTDKPAPRKYFASGATFRMIGHAELADRLPVHPMDELPVIDALIDQFTFQDVEILHLVTDGETAVIRVRVDVSAGRHRYQTELCDIWGLDEAGEITAITEFFDTELVARVVASAMA